MRRRACAEGRHWSLMNSPAEIGTRKHEIQNKHGTPTIKSQNRIPCDRCGAPRCEFREFEFRYCLGFRNSCVGFRAAPPRQRPAVSVAARTGAGVRPQDASRLAQVAEDGLPICRSGGISRAALPPGRGRPPRGSGKKILGRPGPNILGLSVREPPR